MAPKAPKTSFSVLISLNLYVWFHLHQPQQNEEMAGLSVVLENQSSGITTEESTPQVINKTIMFINTKASQLCYPDPAFLQQCFLCRKKLLPGKDIYMYKGDKGFCSEDCRCRQIFMDEEESLKKDKCCSFDNVKSSSSTSLPRKATGNGDGGFAC